MREAAGAVVLRDEPDGSRAVLVVHRPRYDDWSLPKGHLDPGESPSRAAEREVAEETGVHVRLGIALERTRHRGPDAEKLVHWFLAAPVDGDPSLRPADDEVDVARWVTTGEAAELLTYPSDRALVARALGLTGTGDTTGTGDPIGTADPIGTGGPAEAAPPRTPRLGAAPARYSREVGPAAIGERVSVRRLIEDTERGVVPSDVVGRLVGADDEALLIVDRAGHLSVVATADIVASRIVPPHPRLAPEPLPGTRERPLPREAARALVIDEGRTLLVAHLPGDGSTVWTAPGGGLDPGETHLEAARRELAEEIGLDLEPGPWVWSRTVVFAFRGVWIEQHERWFLVTLDPAIAAAIDLARLPLDDVGTAGARWFTLAELDGIDGPRASSAPRALATHLAQLLAAGPPEAPVDVGR